jgi:hypothetical protein
VESHQARPVRIRHHVQRQGYGYLLLLIIVYLGFLLASPEGDAARAITVLVGGLTLILTLWTSGVRLRVIGVVSGVVAALLMASVVVVALTGEVGNATAHIIAFLIVAFAPASIASGTIRRVRSEGVVSVHTMFGVLCIYLLVGMLFGFAYGAIGEISSDPFFAQQSTADASDYLYFSYTTMTTTGFGDLTAATNVGRSFVIIEELIGQIYLVTLVGLIVGNLGRRRADA